MTRMIGKAALGSTRSPLGDFDLSIMLLLVGDFAGHALLLLLSVRNRIYILAQLAVSAESSKLYVVVWVVFED